MSTLGKIAVVISVILIGSAILAMPYVLFIGHYYGWNDPRIADAGPLGMVACGLGYVLARVAR